jgi:hypothetical protein
MRSIHTRRPSHLTGLSVCCLTIAGSLRLDVIVSATGFDA